MLIINVALTGMVPTKNDNPNLPITPSEIAQDALRCYNAGATIFHIHARDEQGKPTWKEQIYRDIVNEIRDLIPDAVICGSTSGRLWSEVDKRSEVLSTDIDMASLTTGSMNFPSGTSVNPPNVIKTLAGRMKEKSITPEIEIFDVGMLDYANHLIEKGILQFPHYFNLFLGSLGTLSAKASNMAYLVSQLPDSAIWAATGVGRYQFPVNCWSIALGGHVRVGLEDTLWMDREKTDPASNVRMVERVVRVGKAMGREPASCEQVRELLCKN